MDTPYRILWDLRRYMITKKPWSQGISVTYFRRSEPGGRSAYRPGGVRCEGGASLVCGCYTERGKACADTAICCPKGWWVARGSASSSRNCEALSTDADTLADRLVVALKLL